MWQALKEIFQGIWRWLVWLFSEIVEPAEEPQGIKLKRYPLNPVIMPRPYAWESHSTLNPAAIIDDEGNVHILYRAMGHDGVSRVGYAKAEDGGTIVERGLYPAYALGGEFMTIMEPRIDLQRFPSGGSWGGCEDPRAVVIDGRVYMTINTFQGWNNLRVAVVHMPMESLKQKKWEDWSDPIFLTKYGDRQKNWMLFPERIDGKFAVLHSIFSEGMDRVHIHYIEDLHNYDPEECHVETHDPQQLPDTLCEWHHRVRSAGPPPLRTDRGWLVMYHAMDPKDPNRYKLGAMLLDLHNPETIIARSSLPILEPDAWYENDWKPGVVYVTGAVIKEDHLYVYYGGGDKHVNVASIDLEELLDDMLGVSE